MDACSHEDLALAGRRPMTRRQMIFGGALAVTAATVGTRLVDRLVPTAPDWERTLVRSAFLQHVGGTFTARDADGGALPLRLEAVDDPPGSSSATDEGRFTLRFAGPADRPITQRTYEMRHPQMGTFPLFLVPTAAAPDGRQQLDAVFNRI